MSTQQRSRLVEPHAIEIEEVAVPEPGPNQVLIEVAAVGICGSDVHYYEHGRIADFVVTEPLVLGHEASGTIRAVGAGVAEDRVGQRVALEPQETCGRCKQCLAGRYNLCPLRRVLRHPADPRRIRPVRRVVGPPGAPGARTRCPTTPPP